jgi:hypothetical protein
MNENQELSEKYPFRFVGPKVGDTAFWVCAEDGETSQVEETTIVGVIDAYDFMVRDNEDERKNYAMFYDIEDFQYHSLTYGDDLFLTKEDAEKYILINS